jgi:hypothetical protein
MVIPMRIVDMKNKDEFKWETPQLQQHNVGDEWRLIIN